MWYTIKINSNTTLQINAECNYSDSNDLTYMYVVQHNTASVTFCGAYIDADIVKYLEDKMD